MKPKALAKQLGWRRRPPQSHTRKTVDSPRRSYGVHPEPVEPRPGRPFVFRSKPKVQMIKDPASGAVMRLATWLARQR